MQVAQPAQEGMKADLERSAGVALARLLVVSALQVGPGAECAPGTSQYNAAELGLLIVDRIECLSEATEHVHRNRIHYFLMVEPQNGHGAVNIERGVLELH